MTNPEDGGERFAIHCSQLILDELRRIQRQASEEGRGETATRAIRQMVQRLQSRPEDFGEPRYRLPALRMQIRVGIVRPLVVFFGIVEDRPLVFIRGVKLLPK